MIERALIHVAGPAGAGKTRFIESILDRGDLLALVARCVRDKALREPRESSTRSHAELRRYRAAGASGVALYEFPPSHDAVDAFFMTDLMADYSEAVLLEGDSPVGYVDLKVFIAPPLPEGESSLFVHHTGDTSARERAKAEAYERWLNESGGVAEILRRTIGGATGELVAGFAHDDPELADRLRRNLLRGGESIKKHVKPNRKPKTNREEWSLLDEYHGIETARLVVANVRVEAERERADRVVADILRLRKDDELFADILGYRGSRVPITAVAANLADPKDAGSRKALARVKRAVRSRVERSG